MGATADIARFIVSTDLRDVGADVARRAKCQLLDCLGVSLAGSLTPQADILRDFVRDMSDKPVASVWGGPLRTSCAWAAFVNGCMAHALDYDDGASIPVPMHPSAPVLPVVLALGELLGANGRDALVAYVIGLEVELRIAGSMDLSHYERGWHSTGIVGTLGAAAAGSKMLNLDETQTMAAFGIAGSMASGLRQNFGTMTKPVHAGQAAKNGMVASLLARRNMTAHLGILEGEFGFLNVLAGRDHFDVGAITASLDRPSRIVFPGTTIKSYPSCRGTHSALDAILDILRCSEFSWQEVEGVECHISPLIQSVLTYEEPASALEAKFSMQYCLAIALLEGKVGLGQFTDQKVRSRDARQVMRKVRLIVDPSLSKLATRVRVRLRDGREYARSMERPRGEGDALSWDEIKIKFNDCAGSVLAPRQAESLTLMVESLEDLSSIAELVAAVCGHAPA